MAETIKLIFSHSFEEKVWKVLTDEVDNYMLFELRSEHSLDISVYSLNLNNYAVSRLPIAELDWWTSLAVVSNGIVYFKQFESEGNPILKKMIAWDLQRNEKIETSVLPQVNHENNNSPHVSFYPKSNEHFKTLKNFIEKLIGKSSVDWAIEYLEFNNYVIVSYYIQEETMANYLLVVDQDMGIVIHENLATELKGIGQQTFIVTDNKLIFVSNKKEVFIYQLN